MAVDMQLRNLGRGRSFEEVAGDYLRNSERDAGFREKERQEAEWVRASMIDPVVGGQDGMCKRVLARNALNAFGDPGLYHYLDESGLGNHPMILRLFYRVGEAITPASMPPTVAPPDEHFV